MTALPLLPASFLRPILDHADRVGCPRSPRGRRLAARVGDPSLLVPYTALTGLLDELLAFGAGEDVGLRIGEATRLERIGAFGERLRRAPTVAAGIELALRQRHNSGERFFLSRRGPDALFHRHVSASVRCARAQERDLALMLTIQFFRLAAGPTWLPAEVDFEGPAPAYAEQLAALAVRGVRFGATHTAVVFPAALLERPLPGPLSGAVQATLLPLPPTDFGGSLRAAVRSLLQVGQLSLNAAAEAAGTSPRSLQRRLGRAGLRFAEVVDGIRFDLACELLADDRVKVVDVAAELGYHDSANFTRAFRRWAGVSPQRYRRGRARLALAS